MHYICSTFGSAGDTYPMLGLALKLRERGHRVTFLVSGYYEEAVKKLGLDYLELGTADQAREVMNHPDIWHPMKAFGLIFREGILPLMRQHYEMLAALHQPGETVGISNCLAFSTLLAQEKLGMPLVTLHVQPAVIWSDIAPPLMPGMFGPRWLQKWMFRIGSRFIIDPVVCPELNRFRGELGLPPVRNIVRWWHSPWCVACLFPEWYCPPQADWPANVIQTDFPLWDEENDDPLPAAVEEFLAAGEPPIVFTPGSANVFGAAFFEAAVEACRRLGRRGILLTRFPEQIPASLPDGVVHFDYVPFTQLLKRAAAVVHHGGIGSTAQGLAAGLPQLIMTLAHDQFDNAARLKRFGVGDAINAPKFRGPLVAKKLEGLLSSASVRRACGEIAGRLVARDGLERMAVGIEERGGELDADDEFDVGLW